MKRRSEQTDSPPVKIEWERIYQTIEACIAEYAVSLLKDEPERQCHPGRWEVAPAQPIDVFDQTLYMSSRRDVVDTNGRDVSRFSHKAAAEFISATSPDIVMVLMDAVETMSGMIARYRNMLEGRDIYTADGVRAKTIAAHSEIVGNRIAERIKAIRDEHIAQLPKGCTSYSDMHRMVQRPKGKGRAANYRWKNPNKNKGNRKRVQP